MKRLPKSIPSLVLFGLLSMPAVAGDSEIIEYLRGIATPISDAGDLSPLINSIGEQRFVLLGEASHGTSEYYTWRSEISKRLIAEKDFRFIVVEGDWSAAYKVNKYIKRLPGAPGSAAEALSYFDRWPEWMWNNRETLELVEWLYAFNEDLSPDERVGFYGMDIYGMQESIDQVISYTEANLPGEEARIRSFYRCIRRFGDDPREYAVAVFRQGADCSGDVARAIEMLHENAPALKRDDETAYFNAIRNALVVKYAERHYRAMADRGPDSWNHRVRHFKRTVEDLSEYYGGGGRGIVWAHNTHVGDARATPMLQRGSENIGYLLREKYGAGDIFIVGFSTYRGSVLAGREWEGPMELMRVPDAAVSSYDYIMYRVGKQAALFIFDGVYPRAMQRPRGHRAKGVTYHPENEHGNYVPTVLPERYNAVLFIKETTALNPLY
jgi:erythromycin esterase